jgi:hypothetical protein
LSITFFSYFTIDALMLGIKTSFILFFFI